VTPEQDERIVVAFERLAFAVEAMILQTRAMADAHHVISEALDLMAMTGEARMDAEHPPKPEPREVEITHLKTEEEIIREQLGGEDAGDNLGDWFTITASGGGDRWSAGPREKAYRQQPSHGGAVEEQGGGAPRTPGAGTGEVPG